jgi:hypothetical protein
MSAAREAVKLLTYPPRPLNSGPLPLAPKKFGRWLYSPKVDGHRGLLHCPTGMLWNRTGTRLAIAGEFTDVIRRLQVSRFQWLDVECLQTRQRLSRGSLLIIDSPMPGTAEERFAKLAVEFPIYNYREVPPDNSLLLIPQMELSVASALELWDELQGLNRTLYKCDYIEGLVCKRADQPYPIQTRDPERKCPTWVKHRWSF